MVGQPGWRAFLDLVQEAQELLMARMAPADGLARGDIEGSKERSGAVATIVVGTPFGLI